MSNKKGKPWPPKNPPIIPRKGPPPSQRMEEQLTCPVCKEVPREGDFFQCIKGHLICEKCFDSLQQNASSDEDDYNSYGYGGMRQHSRTSNTTGSKCPSCRGQFVFVEDKKPQRALIVNQLLETVKLNCKNADKGCVINLVRQDLKAHEVTCGFNQVDCRYKELGCQTSKLAREIKFHEVECNHRFVDCRNAKYGCKFNGEFDAEEAHVAKGACDHHKVGQRMQEMEQKMEEMGKKLQKLTDLLGQVGRRHGWGVSFQ